MANLSIKGCSVLGKEVIEILEMLGGRNAGYSGLSSQNYYYIDECGNIVGTTELPNSKTFVTYTLEQFLEKFPYKVGDKVKVPYEDGRITGNELYEYKIIRIKWDSLESAIKYGLPTGYGQRIEYYSTDNLNIWNKKEIMEVIKIDIPKGYEFAGVDDDNQQVVFEKIGCQYPKTYEECCEMFNCTVESLSLETIKNFRHLIYCRNAYWNIAGEQMGLGKPWKPDWINGIYTCTIICRSNRIIKDDGFDADNRILAFPTEEMRDAFYENFKDLIEQCKELL